MIRLGKISIRHRLSVNEVRKKILMISETLTRDPMIATRLATAASQMCRLMYLQGEAPWLEVEISGETRKLALLLSFRDHTHLPASNFLNGFFDKVNSGFADNSIHEVKAVKYLHRKEEINQEIVEYLQAILESKSRDELMDELQEKNRELQESLENLQRTTSAKERMESELNIGKDIQMSMLPLEFPPFPERKEFDIFAVLNPAREVGGDFYDFFFIDEDQLCFCVGDVSGKGVPSALFMAVTKTLIKSRAKNDLSTASILTHVNDELSRDNTASMFVTIFTVILNVKTGEFVYTNAGHNPPYIKRENGAIERLDQLHGPVIGAMEGMTYREENLLLNNGDLLLMYTDGVTEAMNAEGKLFSEKRLADFLTPQSFVSVEAMVDNTVAVVEEFQGQADQADDITVLAVQFHGTPEESPLKTFDIKIENQLAEISRVNQQFNEFAADNNVPKAVSRKMNLVFDDLLNNVISYAYKDRQKHEIDIRIEVTKDRLAVTISDDGVPFNPFGTATPDTTLSVEDREIGGLGIHLVRSMMDEVDYQRRTDKNVVRLVLYLNKNENA
jgi:sigma-B regulation protein RsbU (phosphoserine phosphatase)